MRRIVAFLALAGLLFLAVVGIRYRLALAQTGGPYGSPFGTAWRFGAAKPHRQ